MIVSLVHDLVNGLLNTIKLGLPVSFLEKVHFYSFFLLERVLLLERYEAAGVLIGLSAKVEAHFVVQVRSPLPGYLEIDPDIHQRSVLPKFLPPSAYQPSFTWPRAFEFSQFVHLSRISKLSQFHFKAW